MNFNHSNKQNYINNTIIDSIYKEPGYQKYYMDNLDIYIRIKDVLGKRFGGCTLHELNEHFNVDPKYLNHTLSIWHKYFCTFTAKYGRVIYDTETEKWYYVYNSNSNICTQNLCITDIVEDIEKYH